MSLPQDQPAEDVKMDEAAAAADDAAAPIEDTAAVAAAAAEVTTTTTTPTPLILPTPEEFQPDEHLRLGRANGNVYQRKPGVDGVHDGQIMVRLKKKRFIVIDYGPDISAEDAVVIPEGAGKQKCITPDCTKVGVPVLLFDSEPNEPSSLYMRSGLCFTCQRLLNEKRRTQRKRKSDEGGGGTSSTPSKHKKLKLNGQVIELSPDAIVINGPVDGAKHHNDDGYGFHEIGIDLQGVVRDASTSIDALVTAAAAAGGQDDVTMLYEKAFLSMTKGVFLLSQYKASWDTNAAMIAAVAQETDPGLADAVASAAAVAAAAAAGLSGEGSGSAGGAASSGGGGGDQNSSDANMIPLLLAAEAKDKNGAGGGDKKEGEGNKSGGDVEVFGV